ncbi:MAG: hypothetical protein K0R29_2107, partial [Pseudobdellovibrio sp.]|nr:hypothetical protein [Pseudobdellovibrio sp.]
DLKCVSRESSWLARTSVSEALQVDELREGYKDCDKTWSTSEKVAMSL